MKAVIFLFAIVYSLPILALDITCETRFTEVIDNKGGVDKVEATDLKAWLIRIKSQNCALKTITSYSQFEFINDHFPTVRQSDALDLINRANAILVAMHNVLEEKEFYTSFEQELKKLPQQIDQKTISQFSFNLPLPDRSGNAVFKATNQEIGNIIEYQTFCSAGQPESECKKWDESIRFFAALTYISSEISEQKSLEVLKTFQEQVAEEILKWDSYYETRKSQLPWEMFANEILQRDIRTAEYFARPPKWDLVLMHPQLVYTDSRGDLSEGQLESQLTWEIVGANFWNDNLLSGISVVTASLDNSDRMGINLILKNRYAIGYLDDSNKGTWYVSVDLYDFVADKKNALEQQLEERMEKFK